MIVWNSKKIFDKYPPSGACPIPKIEDYTQDTSGEIESKTTIDLYYTEQKENKNAK